MVEKGNSVVETIRIVALNPDFLEFRGIILRLSNIFSQIAFD
jgi:hypothetical protein